MDDMATTQGDEAARLRPFAESVLEPGEESLGTCIASQQTTFRGWMVAIVVTDRTTRTTGVVVVCVMALGTALAGSCTKSRRCLIMVKEAPAQN